MNEALPTASLGCPFTVADYNDIQSTKSRRHRAVRPSRGPLASLYACTLFPHAPTLNQFQREFRKQTVTVNEKPLH